MKRQTLTVGLMAVLATSALGQAKLTGIQTNQVGDGLQIVINGEGLSNPRVIRVMHNTSYIVEFNAHLIGKPVTQRVDKAGVQFVQYGWYRAKPPIVRVHVKVAEGVNPVLSQQGGNYVITVGTDALATPADTITEKAGPSIKDLHSQDLDAMKTAEAELKGTATGTTSVEKPFKDAAGTVTAAQATVTAPQTTAPRGNIGTLPAVQPERPVIASQAADTGRQQNFAQKVSLDFVGTDVVQILKALMIQAGVNIVTSPDVSPAEKPTKLTISLNNVELESALSYVTAMAGLRYARVGQTYVVTPAATFSSAMRQIMERSSENYQTKVINLISGEAAKIKETTLKAMPADGRNGFYEIIVPGQNEEMAMVMPNSQTSGAQPEGDGGQQNTQQPQGAPGQQNPNARGRAYYLMIVGDPARLGAVEAYVRQLDMDIARSFSLSRNQGTSTVAVPIQSGQTEKIKTMIEKLLSDNPRSRDYSITETSVKELDQSEQATKFLLMIGPESELETLRSFAVALDKELCKPLGINYENDPAAMVKDYEIVELQYVEPVVAAQDLKGRFKDLWVTVVPDAATPGLLGQGESKKEEAPTDAGGAGGKAPEGQKSELKKELGREPMRLMLRGTRATIEEAKKYIALVDVAPRQIAIELRVMEMTKEDAMRVGIDWSILAGGRANLFHLNQGLGDSSSTPGTFNTTTNFGQKTNGVDGKPFFENVSTLATLDQISNSRNLIARPNALVTHGRETKLFVGDTIRYVKQVQSTQSGITVITDELQVGSLFNIKAKIGAAGKIALDLTQNFSILTAFTPVPGGGQLPQTSDRTSNMFVNMQSGETIAIGGLILDNDRKTYGGIPVLRDLPVIGKIFGRTNNQRVRTEIVFFLTAVEVNAENRATAASPATSLQRSPDPMGDYKKSKSLGKGNYN
ncbi:MAG: hypothetical protein JSS66_12560 [Armatimonadetes bacterium]|nr:hypothetical protein [Armatimonadota bacterium]